MDLSSLAGRAIEQRLSKTALVAGDSLEPNLNALRILDVAPPMTLAAQLAPTTEPDSAPRVELRSLDTIWFQVTGTLCNLACQHCLVSASPTNRTHEFLSLEQVREGLDDGASLGAKEYYFTGGEPFLHPQMEEMIELALDFGPVTVLTNGLLLPADRCRRLKTLSNWSSYSLDLRVSLDGYDAASNDAVRGQGTFDRVLKALVRLNRVGLNPVLTVSEVDNTVGSESGRKRFLALLRQLGIDQPRLKVLPLFSIGAETERGGGYADWQRLQADDSEDWDHLQCSSSRVITDQGTWVCPILVNQPGGRMGSRLADTLGSCSADHSACWTCHQYGVSCRT